MKGQNAFSIYVPGGGWLGTLDTLGNKSMYIYRADEPDTLKMLGNLIDPATTPIQTVAGWNWIGYVPNYSLPVNDALASLPAQTGDLIKSQLSFAQYINADFGWIGNLKYMSPPNGYQIKLAAPGTLIYPPASINMNGGGPSNRGLQQLASAALQKKREAELPVTSFWVVDPTQFEYSMTLIGMLKNDDSNATTGTMEIGAFAANGELRGSGPAIYIAPDQSYLFFLTTYSNLNGEQLHFKLYDSSTGGIQALNEQMYFAPDLHQGTIETPVPFTLATSGTHTEVIDGQSFDVQPNPFHTETMFLYTLAKSQEVNLSVLDMNGKVVVNMRTAARAGLNTQIWKGQTENGASLSPGIYFVRLQTDAGSMVKKVVLQ